MERDTDKVMLARAFPGASRALIALIYDARAAGWHVSMRGSQSSDVAHRTYSVDFRHASGRRGGLRVYPDGTAVDLAVRLDLQRGIRSYRDMRHVLGLEGGAV